MQQQPTPITIPFCENGQAGVDYVDIPNSSGDPQIATMENGFPLSQQILPDDGGAYVTRQEFNGIFRKISAIVSYLSVGGLPTFDDSVTSGYDNGAVLFSYANKYWVQSNKANNTDNFITTPEFIGVSWIAVTDLEAYALLAGNNNFTGDNNFTKTPTIKDATNPKVPNLQAVNLNTLFTILADYATDQDLSLYAKLLSPIFQGNPRAPTPKFRDNSNSLATTGFVNGIFDFTAGYIVFSNGFCIQWGTTSIPANFDSLEVQLPLRYDAGFACANAITQTNANPIGTRFKDATFEKIILSNGSPNSATATWITLGYFSNAIPTGFDFKSLGGITGGNAMSFYNKFFSKSEYSTTGFLDTANWVGYVNRFNTSEKKAYNPNDERNNLFCYVNNDVVTSSAESQGLEWRAVTTGINGVGLDINTDKTESTIVVGSLHSGDNGNNWAVSTGIAATIYAVRYMGEYNGKYYWVSYQGASGSAYLSDDDGISWQSTPLPFSYGLNTAQTINTPMAWGDESNNTKFNVPSMADFAGWNGSSPLYSTVNSGFSWQLINTPANVKIATGFYSEFTGKYVYVILCANGTLYYSLDLITWTSTGITGIQMTYGAALIDAGGILVFGGTNVFNTPAKIWASKDGINWYLTNFLGSDAKLSGLAYCDYSRCLYVGQNSGAFYSYVPLP